MQSGSLGGTLAPILKNWMDRRINAPAPQIDGKRVIRHPMPVIILFILSMILLALFSYAAWVLFGEIGLSNMEFYFSFVPFAILDLISFLFFMHLVFYKIKHDNDIINIYSTIFSKSMRWSEITKVRRIPFGYTVVISSSRGFFFVSDLMRGGKSFVRRAKKAIGIHHLHGRRA